MTQFVDRDVHYDTYLEAYLERIADALERIAAYQEKVTAHIDEPVTAQQAQADAAFLEGKDAN